ncbi:site-specific integrase [Halobacteriales archaeon Cl-PHB]
MQTRPYPSKDGLRVWLSRSDRQELLDVYRDEQPKRQLALQLGLHGLRSDEIVNVTREHFREMEDADGYKLVIPTAKRGARECPVAADVRQTATLLSNAIGLRKDEPLIDVSTKTLRNWIEEARQPLARGTDGRAAEGWEALTMHDLRRTWATDTYYSLAFAGVPIAEQLTMGWGGWAMTESGRETFRENYLGPEPDHITESAMEYLGMA